MPRTRPKRSQTLVAPGTKRCIVCFGAPSTGVTTVLETLVAASNTPLAIVTYLGPASIGAAESALREVDTVLLDVDGGVLLVSDVQAIVDARLVYHGCGAFVYFYADKEAVLKRGRLEVTDEDLTMWGKALHDVDARIRAHSVAYFSVMCGDLAEAVQALAVRVGIRS